MLPDRNILKTAKTILKIQDRLHPLLLGKTDICWRKRARNC